MCDVWSPRATNGVGESLGHYVEAMRALETLPLHFCPSVSLFLSLSSFPLIHPSRPDWAHKGTSMAAMKTGQRECRPDINERKETERDTGSLAKNTHAGCYLSISQKAGRQFQTLLYVHTQRGKAIVGNKAWVLQVQLLTSSFIHSPGDSRDTSFHLSQHFSCFVRHDVPEPFYICKESTFSKYELSGDQKHKIPHQQQLEMERKCQPQLRKQLFKCIFVFAS